MTKAIAKPSCVEQVCVSGVVSLFPFCQSLHVFVVELFFVLFSSFLPPPRVIPNKIQSCSWQSDFVYLFVCTSAIVCCCSCYFHFWNSLSSTTFAFPCAVLLFRWLFYMFVPEKSPLISLPRWKLIWKTGKPADKDEENLCPNLFSFPTLSQQRFFISITPKADLINRLALAARFLEKFSFIPFPACESVKSDYLLHRMPAFMSIWKSNAWLCVC